MGHLHLAGRLLPATGIRAPTDSEPVQHFLIILFIYAPTFSRDGMTDRLYSEQVGDTIEEVLYPALFFYSRISWHPRSQVTGGLSSTAVPSALTCHPQTSRWRLQHRSCARYRSCCLQLSHWATSFNFKDAFFHVSITEGYYRYLSLWFGNSYFWFQALPLA